MAKKIVLFFFITLIFSFASAAVLAGDIEKDSLNEIEKASDSLKNIEKLPGAEEISLIASTIKNAATAYQSIKSQIASAIGYCQKIAQFVKESFKKIKNSGLKIKKYIEDKINFIENKIQN